MFKSHWISFNIVLEKGLICALLITITLSNYVSAQNQERTSGTTKQPNIERTADSTGTQSKDESPEIHRKKNDSPEPISIKRAFLNVPGDQKMIWMAPLGVPPKQLLWLAPFGATTGLLIATDQHNMQREHSGADAINMSDNVANAGTITLAALPATMYLWGTLQSEHRPRETGLLTGEALVNAFIVNQALKRALGRERPTVTDGQGRFFQQFGDPSFPSDHSTLSWTAATVIAHEYPGWLSQTLAYGTAGAVSLARVTGRKHFPSDVAVGAGLGWLIGSQIYRSHHVPDLDDSEYGTFVSDGQRFQGPQTGATYVPMDSWVYPAFDQLAALGYIRTAETGMRPWTRAECARLVSEAEGAVDLEAHDLSSATVKALAAEFATELDGQESEPDTRIEEVYARTGFVSGQPLADDFHFAKTITNDFGRPFGEGVNAIAGGAVRTVVGPLAFYVRAEYQHAGVLPALPETAQTAITTLEGLPFAPTQRTDSLDRFRFLDTYVSFNLHNNVISFGKQTLWWGPGADGPFLESNNAEPVLMLRVSRAKPFVLPWLFGLMGPTRVEAFWGQLEGQQFVGLFDAAGTRDVITSPLHPHPAIQGAKLSFQPTENLEFGFDETAIFSGPGSPLTLHSLLRSYSPGNTIPGLSTDPGDRRSGFDFSYRLPGLRNWLTLYVDSFTEDEFSPITFPRKSSFRSGLYAPRLPKVSRADLRVEGIYTDIPSLGSPGIEYFNEHYLSGYTNYGQIIGNAIGREGRGLNVWSTYRFTPTSSMELHYRNQHVNPEFLQGGDLRDFDLTGNLASMGNLVLSSTLKYERWHFPVLSPTPQTNISGFLQISFRPVRGLSLGRQK